MQEAPSICHLLAILQPVLQSYKHTEDQDAAVGITPLPSTQQRLETPWASRFVDVFMQTQREDSQQRTAVYQGVKTQLLPRQLSIHRCFRGSSADQLTFQFLGTAVLQNCACRV